jgi:hypothetical protein
MTTLAKLLSMLGLALCAWAFPVAVYLVLR